MELYHLSATELATKIKSKEVSSKELTQIFIDRIEKMDGDINAVIVRMFDRALYHFNFQHGSSLESRAAVSNPLLSNRCKHFLTLN